MTKRVSLVALLVVMMAASSAALGANHTYTVVDPGDGTDNNPGDGTCASGTMMTPLPCTLRAAIAEVNALPMADTATIQFSGVTTISPLTGLPGIGHPGITINGGMSKVKLDGSLHSISGTGIDLAVAFPTPANFAIYNMEISGFGGDGVNISGIASTIGSLVQGGNVIHGNGGVGVAISGIQTTANVMNNYIGVMKDGVTPDGNGQDGVDVAVSSPAPNAVNITNNVISANGTSTGGGVHIGAGGESGLGGAHVAFNFIGTDFTGGNLLMSSSLGNKDYGIRITAGSGHIIGGQMIMTPNFISNNGPANNTAHGIEVTGTANFCIITGNIVGLDNLGNAMPNGGDGIHIATDHNIIGEVGNLLNVVSGNVGNGIALTTGGANANVLLNNIIGGGPLGDTMELSRPNGKAGIQIGTSVHDNTIGSTTLNEFNLIEHNAGNGIELRNSGTGNKMSGNHIHDNGKLGIDIDAMTDAVDPIDSGDTDAFSNDEQNYPFLTSAVINGSSTMIMGTLDGTVGDTFDIEFFESPMASATPNTLFMGQHYGEGRSYLGHGMVSIPAMAMAPTPFMISVPQATTAGFFITATATRTVAPLDTSEFSNAIQAITPVELQSFEVE